MDKGRHRSPELYQCLQGERVSACAIMFAVPHLFSIDFARR
jgi:hypothetical protein